MFAFYNRLCVEHGLTPYRRIRLYRTAIDYFLRWSLAKEVDPERWIRARHESIGWKRKILFRNLKSEKFLVNFRAWGDRRQAHEVGQERRAASIRTIIYPSEHMREAARVGYQMADDLAGCYLTATAGDRLTRYNPESKVCPSCTYRESCSERSV